MNIAWLEHRICKQPNGCWIWERGKNRFGYGWATITRKQMLAHRISWEIFNGKIESGKCVLHTCDIPSCVNPDHLFFGTRNDNNKDAAKKGRTNKPKGNRYAAKLNKYEIKIIRENVEKFTHQKLSEIFKVSRPTITNIINRKVYL